MSQSNYVRYWHEEDISGSIPLHRPGSNSWRGLKVGLSAFYVKNGLSNERINL